MPVPSIDVGDLEGLADWVELATLLAQPGQTSVSDISEFLRAAGLVTSDDCIEESEDEESAEEQAELLAQQILQILRDRSSTIGRGYPFEVTIDEVTGPAGGFADCPAYSMMLLADLGRSYKPPILIAENSQDSRLFEKVVEAALKGLGGPFTARFGWPKEPGWPTKIDERIERLASELDLSVDDLEDKTASRDKDLGLDVASRIALHGGEAGTIALLIQAASGANWTTKQGEPGLVLWGRILKWQAVLVRGVAVPWRLTGLWGYLRASTKFDAVMLDRFRLAKGTPDSHLDDVTGQAITSWCEQSAARLPTLA